MQRRTPRNLKSWLVLLSVGASSGALMMMLLRGTAAAPEMLPALRIDDRLLEPERSRDQSLVAEAASGLPDHVRAVGTELVELQRSYYRFFVRGGMGTNEQELPDRLKAVSTAVANCIALSPEQDRLRPLLRLRAMHYMELRAELLRSEALGKDTDALMDLGAQFVLRMREMGYLNKYRTKLSDDEFATLYKLAWNTSTGLYSDLGWDKSGPYNLSPEHRKLLVGLGLREPVTGLPPDTKPSMLRRARGEAMAIKVQEAARLDANYPANYALGIAYTLADKPALAAEHFAAAEEEDKGPSLRIGGYLLQSPGARVD